MERVPVFQMNMFRELCYGIIRYIDDPATFAAFSLAHSACWKAAREFSPLKKVEFSRKVGYENSSVLPNGAVHGRENGLYCYTIYDNSKLVATVYYNGQVLFYHSNSRKYVYDNLIVAYTDKDISFKNGRKYICALHCPLCKKYHDFYAAGGWRYKGNCLHKGLIPYRSHNLQTVSARKANIVRSIINFARNLH